MTMICSIAALFQRVRFPEVKAADADYSRSFVAVYRDHFEFVWRTVRSLGVPPELVDDATQEVFIIVHRKLSGFVPDAPIRNWIFGIVRRVAKDFRRAKNRRGVAVPVDESKLGADTRDPYIKATQNQALRLVMSFADTQEEEWRAIFILSELEQMSGPEIGKVMNMNVNTVYTRLRSIKAQLSVYISDHAGSEGGVLHE
ncbi:MAG: sigma-70 family RNA polymerase sigma factor [Deltaproteobacteria bacterium]|nr:sigma-70 family RNA polymerase sigma factor [Deltaproteobacteria bacterium]MBN2674530.1 sigma-70 family RNA polymerase sigma factor [Deltaproteobacteria bacterium]